MATKYLDFTSGSDAADATSFANRVKTITSGITAARTAPGDLIRCMKSLDPTTLSQAGSWVNGTNTITLAAALNKLVDDCSGAWVLPDAVNVTQSNPATRKEGATALQLVIGAGFTTGQLAYKTLTSTDFSANQQLCFWIRSTVAIAANTLRVDLCSDTLGATPVDSFTVNVAINPTSTWHAIVLNKGSALGATIQSVNLQALLDPGTTTIIIDDIFTARAPSSADCITLHTLFAKSSAPTGANHWYKVQSVNNATIAFDGLQAANPTTPRTYDGTTESVTTYVRQPIVLAPVTSTTTIIHTIQEAGTYALPSTYSGGWDTTNMTSQTGETWLTTINGAGTMISGASVGNFINFEKIGIVWATFALTFGNYCNLTDIWCVGCDDTIGCNTAGYGNSYTRCHASNCGNEGFLGNQVHGRNVYTDCHVNGCTAGPGFQAQWCSEYINCTSRNNSTYGWFFYAAAGRLLGLRGCSTAGNTTSGLGISGTYTFSHLNIKDMTIEESTEITLTNTESDQGVYSHDHDGVTDNHIIFCGGYRIIADTAVRHTASGVAWRFAPTSTTRNSMFPIRLQISTIAVAANALVTVKAWVRRDHTDIVMRLVCRGGQINGVASDVTATIAAAINTWEELTITFTPTEFGVVEITAECYDGINTTKLGYVDDMTITQA